MIGVNNRLLIAGLAFCGSAAILAFAVMRYFSGALIMAAFDAGMATIFFVIGCYTYMTGSLTVGRYVIAFVAVVGAVTTTVLNVSTGPYWVYVMVVVLFYILPYRHAILICLLTVVILFALLYREGIYVQLLHFLATIVLISIFSFLFSLNVERTTEKLQDLSLQDDLTGVGNRRAFIRKVREAVNLFKRFGFPASLIYIDVDFFKSINDAQGHFAGDKVLVRMAECLSVSLRKTDRLFRIGGDEFVIVVEGGVQSDAEGLAEKLRKVVSSEDILDNKKITISLGVAEINESDTADDWVTRADDALYKAKGSGRNQVGGYTPELTANS